ncbi:hypothetical protein QQS21_006822 [Conoideocrella luteorostrata]|uniref:Alginate lyase domain-containing protein n=1 Tax=Conoideocrella luteorostrata TaxID=1105319 RepID=A0AAJ0FT34_9HYPO|nr:hypothetical protein QQS21_006822 [Conoideocrella luteorostrata]
MLDLAVISLTILALMTASLAEARRHYVTQRIPETVVIDGSVLDSTRQRLRHGDKSLNAQLQHLKAQADSWLSQGPWTVTTKAKAPPNGTIHDYASQAPYWWPNPNTADKCPYVQKDGQRNPEADQYQDRLNVGKMFNSTYILSLAWYYTQDEKYSAHAASILRTWFLDRKTRMNPNLNHAQIIPCANSGRAIGIIDFSQEYTNVLDAVSILNTGAPGWTKHDKDEFLAWNTQFLNWLYESSFGKSESGQSNNHGTFANMQTSAIALFTGKKSLAAQISKKAKALINTQISTNGSQPEELARTRSWHYSNFNLGAHLRWALIAKKVGIDLYRYKGPEGQSLFGAVNFLVRAAARGESEWQYEELEFKIYAATDNVHAAALAGLCQAKRVIGKLGAPPAGDIFDLRPAPQQLDSIVTL